MLVLGIAKADTDIMGDACEDSLSFALNFENLYSAFYKGKQKLDPASMQGVSIVDLETLGNAMQLQSGEGNHLKYLAEDIIDPNIGTIEMQLQGKTLKDPTNKFLFDMQKNNEASDGDSLNLSNRMFVRNVANRLFFYAYEIGQGLSSQFLMARINDLSSLHDDKWYTVQISWDTANAYAKIKVVDTNLFGINTRTDTPSISIDSNTYLYIGSQVNGEADSYYQNNAQCTGAMRNIKIYQKQK